jgi:uncharacterized protein YceK
MLLRIILLAIAVALMGGCETIKNKTVTWELEENSKSYNKMLRWNEMEKAEWIFPPEELREEFKRKVRAASTVKVTDYRVKKMECFPEKGEATVIVDIDYFREPSITLKTLEDRQEWKYVEEAGGKKIWRLMTLPPDFP